MNNNNRTVIREYIGEDYHTHCPPGLAKKHNGCLPPGQAKKRYIIGRQLPSYVVYKQVPQDLLVRLEPVPLGYEYVQVDREVLLTAEGSKKVIDAITLFPLWENKTYFLSTIILRVAPGRLTWRPSSASLIII